MPQSNPESIYAPRPCTLLEVQTLTAQEKLFRLQLCDGSELEHQPGQFVQVSIPGLTEAPISVASSPTRQGYFELGVRKVGRLNVRPAPAATGRAARYPRSLRPPVSTGRTAR
ncbi:MAG: hypothetical protein GXP51_07270 [Deltaproteobacteria bacterium]|nr:hypothetical protein [Deltaproteobacteria bacterium]